MENGGFMRIFKLEFQKIMKNPMLWLLAVIFCLVNCLIIYNEVGNKDTSKELVIMHDIIKKTDDTNHSRQAKNRNERKQLSKVPPAFNGPFVVGITVWACKIMNVFNLLFIVYYFNPYLYVQNKNGAHFHRLH